MTEKPRAVSNAWLRILTGLIGAPLLLGGVYLGGWYFAALVLLGGCVAQVEVYGLMEKASLRPWKAAGLLIGALLVVRSLTPAALPLAGAGALAVLAWSPLSNDEQPLSRLAGTFFGALYPTALMAFILDLRLARGSGVGDREAFYLTAAVLVLVWATDVAAYVVGKNLGRHPLAPRISPRKTWEGSLGGAVGAVLAAVGFKLTLLTFLAWPHVLALALICGVFSQLGDLAESKIKRSVGAKDSGAILPGHGGMLDRFDALLLAAPTAYLYLAYVARLFDG